ncbi:septal ring lytic transglycosylase RlpA family protein [Pusillimonas sp. MFBS29]|uniref:septal ring lytic transglycosylase RlpA family protein n=1 Tax=Pusillimonas sp. MFBS29 TaxID=2886690 RepID=UPI00351CD327
MTRMRSALWLLLGAGLLVLAGCSGPGGGSTSTSSKGGYYKDDGPGSDIPDNIAAIPDAVPRIEKHARANFRPYVVFGKRYVPVSDEKPFRQQGTASWYGRKFHGNKTANGEVYDMYAMTAAHPTLPLPSYARVTHASNGKNVIVRINDRGPFHSKRIIDLSYVAAAKLGLIGPGSGQVIVEAITNQDIRDGNFGPPPRPKPVPVAPPAPAPLLVAATQTAAPHPAPATPDALAALQHQEAPISTSAVHTPAPPADQIYLQFAAFSAAGTAEDLAQELGAQIKHVETRPVHVQASSDLYRVRVGPYPSRTAAVNAAVRIEQETGQPSALTVGHPQ